MNKEQITEAWDELTSNISLNDIMMIALFEGTLPDSAFDVAEKSIIEHLLDEKEYISIESIERLLEAYSEFWSRMFLGLIQ